MSQFRARPPAVPTVLLDDAVVRVTRWDFEPGADTGHHVHGLGYVVVPMTDCDFLIEEETGDRRVHTKTGAVYRREAGVAPRLRAASSSTGLICRAADMVGITTSGTAIMACAAATPQRSVRPSHA